jgi:CheY-like chemotaxis protein
MPSILIFESDLAFANELQAELTKRSCTVSIVDDATIGLQQAAAAPPDLILLCTELPRMNGFSVCNRLKRDPELRHIPVIIMSANASEENFQQHRNLTSKRADDYVHKPISTSDMMVHIESLISLNGQSAPRQSLPSIELSDVEDLDADEILVDELVEDLVPAARVPTARGETTTTPSSRPTELELSEFTENAFDALLAQPPERALTEPPPATTYANGVAAQLPSVPPPAPLPGAGSGSASGLPGRHQSSPPSESRFGDENTRLAFVQAQSDLSKAKERLADLEDELVRAREKESTLEKLYAELDDAKARLASGGGGRAKEILDLREALNQKDKEILGLRDDLTSKDKQLLANKDVALDLERKTADAEDRAVELEKRMASLERSEVAAQQDRDQANKRADVYKRKQEKLGEELATIRTELDDLESARQNLTGQLGSTQQKLEAAESTSRELNEKLGQAFSALEAANGARENLQSRVNSLQDNLNEVTHTRDELQDRVSRAESRINALESERRALAAEFEDVKKKLASTEQQLDESQLQAAEQGDRLDRYRVAAGELGGLLNDAVMKLKEIDTK